MFVVCCELWLCEMRCRYVGCSLLGFLLRGTFCLMLFVGWCDDLCFVFGGIAFRSFGFWFLFCLVVDRYIVGF